MAINPNLFAGLGPFAGLTQAATESLSKGVGQLFGIKDPVLERNRILSQVNYEDPASLKAAAQELALAGYVDQAVALAGQGRDISQKEKQFGLEQRRVAATEKQTQQGDERIKLSRDELELKKEEFDKRSDLTDLQIKKAKQELEDLKKDYTPSDFKDNNGNALFNKKGEVGYFYFDDTTNTIKRHSPSQGMTTIKPVAASPYDFLRGAMAGQQPVAAGKQPPIAVTGQPQGQAGGSLSNIQARAAQALKDRMNK